MVEIDVHQLDLGHRIRQRAGRLHAFGGGFGLKAAHLQFGTVHAQPGVDGFEIGTGRGGLRERRRGVRQPEHQVYRAE